MPRRGMAVVHFPCSAAQGCGFMPLVVDPNAEHEAEEAIDPKFICQQFVWSSRPLVDDTEASMRARFADLDRAQPDAALSEDVL